MCAHQLVHMWTGPQSLKNMQTSSAAWRATAQTTVQSDNVNKYEWLLMKDDGTDKHSLAVPSTDLPSI